MDIDSVIDRLAAAGNMRHIPEQDAPTALTDLSSNDYLGFGDDVALRQEFFGHYDPADLLMTSSASRLLASHQSAYTALEQMIQSSYGHGRRALLFNSGYHANAGLPAALADKSTIILADKLVHASIIDGIRLSGAPFERFRHNDYGHLQRLIEGKARQFDNVIIIAESIYSMDGDRADIHALAEAKHRHPGAMLYIDEAHAVGAVGPAGLGEVMAADALGEVDILVGTFGKALASMGAFALVSPQMRDFLVNRSRPLIFSTALPPAQTLWTSFIWQKMLAADDRRATLAGLAKSLAEAIPGGEPSHIRPLIVGSATRAIEASEQLKALGFKALPIRTPTVPAGTERLRFSLSAAIPSTEIDRLKRAMRPIT